MSSTSLRARYRRVTGRRCEYCAVIRPLASVPPSMRSGFELEHIFGRRGGRVDVWSNFVMSCPGCHEWKHRHPREGRLAGVWIKRRKWELDEGEFERMSGRRLVGWLEHVLSGELLPGFADLAVELLNDMNCGGGYVDGD